MSRFLDPPAFDGEEIVVGLVALPSPQARHGLQQPRRAVVTAVNRIPIKNLGHLVQVLRDCPRRIHHHRIRRPRGRGSGLRASETLAATGHSHRQRHPRPRFAGHTQGVEREVEARWPVLDSRWGKVIDWLAAGWPGTVLDTYGGEARPNGYISHLLGRIAWKGRVFR